jgi:hypothetical protein
VNLREIHDAAIDIADLTDRVSNGEPPDTIDLEIIHTQALKLAAGIPDIEIHEASDWAALYVNGVLDTVGEEYVAREALDALLGITVIQDDAFFRGGTSRNGVAPTLTDVATYRQERLDRLDRAAKLRAEAAALIAEADAL